MFIQVLGLVALALIATHLISLIILFNLPPPQPEMYRLSEVVTALKKPGVHPIQDGRPLIVKLRSEPPKDTASFGRWRDGIRATLAESLNVAPDQLVIDMGGPRRTPFMPPRRFEGRSLRIGPPPDEPGGHMFHNGPGGPGGPRAPDGPGDDFGRPPNDMDPRLQTRLRLKDEGVIFAPFKIAVRQADGQWLTVKPQPSLKLYSWQGLMLMTLLLSMLVISPLAWLFARRLTAPIAALADAAERLGRDPRAPPLSIRGSSEVGAAVSAFNQMQDRLRRYVDDRTAMAGAMAHDLRTPLTRMRFRIEAVPEDIRAKLAADISQMDAMVAATMGFVADATKPGERTRLELASLVETVLDEAAETGADATVERSERIIIEGDPVGLRRLISNLVENALKYGQRARGRIYQEDGQAVIEIDDDGPGVPLTELDRVFDPFYRREPSRNRETGGIGLGLAVVRSVARSHGGDVVLINRPGGGLTARAVLPL